MTKNQIRRLRLALRLTQAELAEKVGVNHSTVSLWESGERNPRGSAKILLRQLADQVSKAA